MDSIIIMGIRRLVIEVRMFDLVVEQSGVSFVSPSQNMERVKVFNYFGKGRCLLAILANPGLRRRLVGRGQMLEDARRTTKLFLLKLGRTTEVSSSQLQKFFKGGEEFQL